MLIPSEQTCEIVAKFRGFLAIETRIRQICAKKRQKLAKLAKLCEYASIKRKKHERKWTKIFVARN